MNSLIYEEQEKLASYYRKVLGSPESLVAMRGVLQNIKNEIHRLEDNWLTFEEHNVNTDELPTNKEEFVSWYIAKENKLNIDIQLFIEYVRQEATVEQMAYYICMEELVDGSFDDLMAMVQIGMPVKQKMVAGENYWDEMGNGDFTAVHTSMFKQSSAHMRKVLDGAGISVKYPTLECLMNGNVLLMWAIRREYNVRLIGAMGLVEGSAPVRFRATTEALERLKLPTEVIAYHKTHIKIDTRHSCAWLERVLPHYADCGPDVLRELSLGVAIRYNVAIRYYEHMYQMMRSIQ
ncbi:iron-containing redox enzyme family protein [Pseudomonas sp. KU43P]|uniref:iron-containing redox enzyme family protein n=1 Tax=Pseudomonas sp. KU43P TaxID=2487887 RepID=UPI0012A89697|nr:iron-containing redox enzyme family protein [Pseudomonas sp. KU43P]BBH45427.1 hypothetical protein KU43P_19040 [Pseudomonas sp. KU43P]